MSTVLEISDYDPAWPGVFATLGGRLRSALGDVAVRIDHIGSTSVPGLAAKPIIDVQIAVRSLNPAEPFAAPLTALGYVFRRNNPELTKRYFREPPGTARTHVHVRQSGSFSQQFALLFRDYLREHPPAAAAYGAEKRRLAPLLRQDPHAYTDAKDPFIWQTIRAADAWAQQTGWQPPATDA